VVRSTSLPVVSAALWRGLARSRRPGGAGRLDGSPVTNDAQFGVARQGTLGELRECWVAGFTRGGWEDRAVRHWGVISPYSRRSCAEAAGPGCRGDHRFQCCIHPWMSELIEGEDAPGRGEAALATAYAVADRHRQLLESAGWHLEGVRALARAGGALGRRRAPRD
jgi:hypothetical protein